MADFWVDLAVLLVTFLSIVFSISFSGPMQWWLAGSNITSNGVLAGIFEFVGVVNLSVLA